MKTIQMPEVALDTKNYCGECSLWQPMTRDEKALYNIPAEVISGRCSHGKHMSEHYYECIYMNLFCLIDDHNCTTCSRQGCKINGIKNQGCVTDWRHQFGRAMK